MQTITEKVRGNKRPVLKIAAMTTMCIFSLLTVFLGTMSWFTAVRRTKADGDEFEVVSYDGLVNRVEIFMTDRKNTGDGFSYEPRKDSQCHITGNVNQSGILEFEKDHSSLSLGVYDQMESKDQTSYQSGLLYRIWFNMDVYEKKEDVSIQVSTSTALESSMLYETVEDEHRIAKNQIQKEGNKLSSIIGFTTDSTFETFGKLVTSDGNTFLDNSTYRTTLSLWDKNSGNRPTREKSYVDVICDYQSSFVELLYSLNLGNPVISDLDFDTYIDFTKDWTISIK